MTLPKLTENMVPFYILDQGYNLDSWNIACDEALARHLGWKIGMSATKIIETLVNAEECRARSFKVFGMGVPLVDWEPLIFDHPRYGRTTFIKVAAQVLDDQGKFKFWTVQYNIVESPKRDLFFDDIMKRMESELKKEHG